MKCKLAGRSLGTAVAAVACAFQAKSQNKRYDTASEREIIEKLEILKNLREEERLNLLNRLTETLSQCGQSGKILTAHPQFCQDFGNKTKKYLKKFCAEFRNLIAKFISQCQSWIRNHSNQTSSQVVKEHSEEEE